jgi:hypothetical protein
MIPLSFLVVGEGDTWEEAFVKADEAEQALARHCRCHRPVTFASSPAPD